MNDIFIDYSCGCGTFTEENLNWKLHFLCSVYDGLRDLVPFVQFKKREKHPWMSVTYSNAAG